MGKDYTLIPYWMEVYEIRDVKFCMELIMQLDNHAVEESSKRRDKAMKEARKRGKKV